MKIAALQMVSTTNVDANLATASRLIAQAARDGAELVVLPEYFCLMGRTDRDKLSIAEPPAELAAEPPAQAPTLAHAAAPNTAPIQRMLSQAARAHGVWLVGGTLPMRSSDPDPDPDPNPNPNPERVRVRNANCVYAPDGRLAARYDKIHLFSYDNGRERYDEGASILAGDAPVAVQAGSVRLGLSVCYDLRFPELYRELTFAQGPVRCDLMSVPAAFTYTTGVAHWELLLRARAVENQCYVIAAAQGGRHENGRRTFGHSMIVDPWGEVLAVLPEGEGVVLAELDPARIASVRSQLPALDHRRIG